MSEVKDREAEKMAREFAIEHEANVCETCEQIPQEDRIARDEYVFLKGYLAGQQSLWRESGRELPPLYEKVLLFDKVSRSKVIGWLEDYQDEDGERNFHFVDGEGDIVFQGAVNMPTHWMPITMPATKEGAE